MHILLTGGAGFIGSHVYDHFIAAGHTVVVLDDLTTGKTQNVPDATFYHTEINDRLVLEQIFDIHQFDAICHHAAKISVSESVKDPLTDARTNCLGALTLLEVAKKYACRRFIFASSGGTLYGEVEQTKPAREYKELKPTSPYGMHKWLGERYLEFYARTHGMEAVILRYGNVYGPRQNPHGEAGVIGIFCQKTLYEEPITIYGRGDCIRDYVYVEDVAQANVQALEMYMSPGDISVFNIGTGVGLTVNHVAYTVRREIAEQFPGTLLQEINYAADRPGDLKTSVLNPAMAAANLQWQATTPFTTGIKKTVRWFADHL